MKLKNTSATKRTTVKRMPKRGCYDKETIYSILDDSFLCHVAFAVEGQPYIIPVCYGRENNKIYFHGSVLNRMLKHMKGGFDICVEVSTVDSLVLARSAFHHSVNYRSVIIFGKGEEVTDAEEKERALKVITEQVIPGRWNETRRPDKKELKVTAVCSLDISEASAKIRNHGVVDEKKDMDSDIWAGLIPLKLIAGKPAADPLLKNNVKVPDYIKRYRK
jgi:uncharacterized protein